MNRVMTRRGVKTAFQSPYGDGFFVTPSIAGGNGQNTAGFNPLAEMASL